MHKIKKSGLRDLLVLSALSLSHFAFAAAPNKMKIRQGESLKIEISSDELIKVKGSSVHVVELKEGTYEVIGVKKGIAIIDPSPNSRILPPIIVEVLSSAESDELKACDSIGLVCRESKISGVVSSYGQLSFVHSQSLNLVDFTYGVIGSESSSVLKALKIESIEKIPGRRIAVKINCFEHSDTLFPKQWPNFQTEIICVKPKSRWAKFFFEVEKSDGKVQENLQQIQKMSSTFPFDLGSKKTSTLVSSAEKSLLVTDESQFQFHVQIRDNLSLSLDFSVSGFMKSQKDGSELKLSTKSLASSSNNETTNVVFVPFDKKVTVSETAALDKTQARAEIYPWGNIPIIGIMFKYMSQMRTNLIQKVSVLLSSETPF